MEVIPFLCLAVALGSPIPAGKNSLRVAGLSNANNLVSAESRAELRQPTMIGVSQQ